MTSVISIRSQLASCQVDYLPAGSAVRENKYFKDSEKYTVVSVEG